MASRLPVPGGDPDNWGEILNDFLSQAHSASGLLADDTVGTAQLQDGAILNAQISSLAAIAKTKLANDVQASLIAADNALPSAQKGAANGVATLDSGTKLTAAQLPTNVTTKVEARRIENRTLRGSKAIIDQLDAPLGAPVPLVTLGSGYAFSLGTENSTSTLSGSIVTPYTANQYDSDSPKIRVAGGPFEPLFGSNANVGAVQTRATGSWGPTGLVGQYWFDFDGDRFEVRMRDGGSAQYLTVWVDGRPHVLPSTPQQLSPGDGLYHLILVDLRPLGPRKKRTIMLEGEALTFGGVRHFPTDTVSYPATGDPPRLLIIGDSYSVPGQGQFRGARGYPFRLARRLGWDVHVAGFGGTGYTNAGSGNKYYARIADEVTPFGPYDAIVVQSSSNDRTVLQSSDVEQVFNTLLGAYPDTPLYGTAVMHLSRGNSTLNAQDDAVDAIVETAAGNLNIPLYDPIGDGTFYGTGYQGAATGDGNADYYAWTDSSHPSPEGAIALGDDFARWLSQQLGTTADLSVNTSRDREEMLPGIVPTPTAAGTAALSMTANRAWFCRFVPSRDMTITKAAIHLSTAAGADDALDIAIYEVSGTSLSRLVSSGATTGKLNSTPGIVTIDVAATTLLANKIYYVGMSVGTVGGTAAAVIAHSGLAGGFGQLFGTGIPAVECGYAAASHPLPSTVSALLSTINNPIIALRES